jgi:hypothetical protein
MVSGQEHEAPYERKMKIRIKEWLGVGVVVFGFGGGIRRWIEVQWWCVGLVGAGFGIGDRRGGNAAADSEKN